MKKLKRIFLVLTLTLFLSTAAVEAATATAISLNLPTWSSWVTAATKVKNDWVAQEVEAVYVYKDRTLSLDLVNVTDGTSNTNKAIDEGETVVFDDQLHIVGGSTYSLKVKTRYPKLNSTPATLVWEYN